MKYTLRVAGCDQHTAILLDLNVIELAFLKRVIEQVNSAPEAACAPTMQLFEGDALEYKLDWDWNLETEVPGSEKPTGRMNFATDCKCIAGEW